MQNRIFGHYGFYYEPVPETKENLALMRRLDQMHLEHPVYGSHRKQRLAGLDEADALFKKTVG